MLAPAHTWRLRCLRRWPPLPWPARQFAALPLRWEQRKEQTCCAVGRHARQARSGRPTGRICCESPTHFKCMIDNQQTAKHSRQQPTCSSFSPATSAAPLTAPLACRETGTALYRFSTQLARCCKAPRSRLDCRVSAECGNPCPTSRGNLLQSCLNET